MEKYDPDTRMRKAQAEQQRAMAAVLQQSGELNDLSGPNLMTGTKPRTSTCTQDYLPLPQTSDNGLAVFFLFVRPLYFRHGNRSARIEQFDLFSLVELAPTYVLSVTSFK